MELPTNNPTLTSFRSPQTVISRFVARRTVRSAAFWAVMFGVVVLAKSAGYADAYPSAQARAKLAVTFGNNIGLSALFGIPHKIETVLGFTVWNSLSVMIIIGSVWAFLLATKTFRGEEDAGRWELLLTGLTTPRRAAANTLAGLGATVSALFAALTIIFILVGKIHSVDFGIQAAAFFALAGAAGATMFIAVGALASQFMPTRSRAAAMSAAIFGASFLIKAMGDTTNAHWLLDVSPLGWIEKLQPLYGSQPLWLLPIAGLTALLCVVAIYLSGRRDLGSSIIPDKESAKPRFRLLNSPLGAAFRLNRGVIFGWFAGISFMGFFFGLLAKSAAQALTQSANLGHTVSRIIRVPQILGTKTFLGMVFFLMMTLIMASAASAVSRVREDEANGYLDNFLVRPVSRNRWLGGRILIIIGSIAVAGLLGGAWNWVGESSQHAGVAYHTLLIAGMNAMAPALFVMGIGMFAMGIIPRLAPVISFFTIAWSFLVQIISSGININHWILDTSILHHIALAPAEDPNWRTAAVLITLGAALTLIGMVIFDVRDLQNE